MIIGSQFQLEVGKSYTNEKLKDIFTGYMPSITDEYSNIYFRFALFVIRESNKDEYFSQTGITLIEHPYYYEIHID